MKKKWFFYTVVLGMIPFLTRIFIFFLFKNITVNFLFEASDFIILAIVTNISTINEVKKIDCLEGFCAIFLLIFASIFLALNTAIPAIESLVDKNILFYLSITLSVVSCIITYYTYCKKNKNNDIIKRKVGDIQ